jgi:HlyD family secretion protein
MTSRRRILISALVLALLAGALIVWRLTPAGQSLFGSGTRTQSVLVSGNIEAHESVLSFTDVQAPISELAFDEGAVVKAGTVLARLDDRLYRQQTEIDRTNVQVAAAQLAVSQSNFTAAQSNVASDQFDVSEKQRDYARDAKLVKTSAVSVQARDLALTALNQSLATLDHDKAMVLTAQANIGLAAANLAATRARLGLDDITLGYTVLTAPFDGVIAVREAELGELAASGVAIFTLDDLDHVWLRAYVNETDLGKIRLDEAVDVTTDTYPGHIYHGQISFISPEAEFTPKTVETNAERVTLVYRIRIDIYNPTHELLPGMPADASIALLPPGP